MTDDVSPATSDALSAPIATIYQNSDQVAGILQQIVRQPLLTEESREVTAEGGTDTAAEGSAAGKGSAKAKLPFFGGVDLATEARASLSSSWTQTTWNSLSSAVCLLAGIQLASCAAVFGAGRAPNASDIR